MLSFEEFMSKRIIVLDKALNIIIFERGMEVWHIYTITRKTDEYDHFVYSDDEAYEYYRDRMESYGYRPFTIFSK